MKTTYENIAKTRSAGLELVGKNKLFTFLDLTTTVNLYYSKLDGFTYQPADAKNRLSENRKKTFHGMHV